MYYAESTKRQSMPTNVDRHRAAIVVSPYCCMIDWQEPHDGITCELQSMYVTNSAANLAHTISTMKKGEE